MPDAITEDLEYGLRKRRLRDLMDDTMREKFRKECHSGKNLYNYFKSLNEENLLDKVLGDLEKFQRDHILPPSGERQYVDLDCLDTKTLGTLLIHLCKEKINEEHIKTIIRKRNEIAHGNLKNTRKEDFENLYSIVKEPLFKLGCSEDDLKSVRFQYLDSRRNGQRYNICYSVPDFSGRTEQLNSLKNLLGNLQEKCYGIIVSGPASVGKSELLWRCFDELEKQKEQQLSNLFCLDASTSVDLEESFRKLSAYVQPGATEKADLVQQPRKSILDFAKEITELFRSNNPYSIFLLDNLSDHVKGLDKLFEIFYNDNIVLLITTTSSDWLTKTFKNKFQVIHLDVFTPAEAIAYVKNSASESLLGNAEEGQLNEFIMKCGYHPCTLRQTIDSLKNGSTKLRTIVDWIKTSSESDSLDVTRFLNLVCFLNCQKLSKDVLIRLADDKEENADAIIDNLKKRSLIISKKYKGQTNVREYYTLSSMKMETIRKYVSGRTAGKFFEIIFKDLDNAGDSIFHYDVWDTWYRHYYFMFERFKENEDVFERFVKETYENTDNLENVFRNKGQLSMWKDIIQSLYEYYEKTRSPYDSYKRVKIALKLADCKIELGELDSAYELLTKVEKGKDFQQCFDFVKNKQKYQLACCLKEMGRYDEAMVILQKLEEGGKYHRATLYSTMFACLRQRGRLNEARRSYEKLLGVIDKDSPNTQVIKGNMALCLQQLRHFDDSLAMYDQVLSQHKSSYGVKHANYLSVCMNKASCFREQGQLDAALKQTEKCVGAIKSLLGQKSDLYLTAVLYQGRCLLDLRRLVEAKDCFEEVCEGRKAKEGDENPAYFVPLILKALCMGEMKETDVALEILTSVKEKIKSVLNDKHPLMLNVEFHTARCFYVANRYEEALAAYMKVDLLINELQLDRLKFETKSMIARCYMRLPVPDINTALKLFQELKKDQCKQYQRKNDVLLLETKRDIVECKMSRQPQKSLEMLENIKELQIEEIQSKDYIHPAVDDTEKLIQRCRNLITGGTHDNNNNNDSNILNFLRSELSGLFNCCW